MPPSPPARGRRRPARRGRPRAARPRRRRVPRPSPGPRPVSVPPPRGRAPLAVDQELTRDPVKHRPLGVDDSAHAPAHRRFAIRRDERVIMKVAQPCIAKAKLRARAALRSSSTARALRRLARSVRGVSSAPRSCSYSRRRARGRDPDLIIEGAGDGHGVGMSQGGALGYADAWLQRPADPRPLLQRHVDWPSARAHGDARCSWALGSSRCRLKRYVRGVVAAEMPASWPAAALEAQAIASRTYAITSDAGGSRFDVYSDTRSQVYEGRAAETPSDERCRGRDRGPGRDVRRQAGDHVLLRELRRPHGGHPGLLPGLRGRAVAEGRRRPLRNERERAGGSRCLRACAAPARRPRSRAPSRHRSGRPRRIRRGSSRRWCSARPADAGERPRTRVAARADERLGVLHRAERLDGHTRARLAAGRRGTASAPIAARSRRTGGARPGRPRRAGPSTGPHARTERPTGPAEAAPGAAS